MTARRAIARSCNTWFYQAAIRAGGEPLREMAGSFGYGERVALPLGLGRAGRVPSALEVSKDGDIANFAIGQGYVEATPLQMGQQMARLSQAPNAMKPLRWIREMRGPDGGVTTADAGELGAVLDWPESVRHFEFIREGMVDIVHRGYGTGKRLAVPGVEMAGITSTSQKARSKVAIAGGYLPADDPRYAFVLCLEGDHVSGSKEAALAASAILRDWMSKP